MSNKTRLSPEEIEDLVFGEEELDNVDIEEAEAPILVCRCDGAFGSEDCDYESHRPSRNDASRPFASLIIDNGEVGKTEADAVKWLQDEYQSGTREGQRWLVEHEMSLDLAPEPPIGNQVHVAGYMAVVLAWQQSEVPQGFTKAHLMRQLHQEFSYRRLEAADKLSKESAEAGMAPLGVGHWDAEEVSDARAIIEDWCRYSNGKWSPILERSVQFESQSWLADATANGTAVALDAEVRQRRVQEMLKQLTADRPELGLKEGKRTGISIWLGAQMEPDALEFVFVIMPEGSRARLRGERVWAIAYYPTTYPRADGSLGSGWYNVEGHVGVARTWSSLAAADADFATLLSAVVKMRRFDRQQQAVRDEEPEWMEIERQALIEDTKPKFVRTTVPTL